MRAAPPGECHHAEADQTRREEERPGRRRPVAVIRRAAVPGLEAPGAAGVAETGGGAGCRKGGLEGKEEGQHAGI